MKHWELFVGETMWFPDDEGGVTMVSAEQRQNIKQPLRSILTESKQYLKEYCEYVSLERSRLDDGRFPVSVARLVPKQGEHVKLSYKAGRWVLERAMAFQTIDKVSFGRFEEAAEAFVARSLEADKRA